MAEAPGWTWCQLGGREGFLLPLALSERGRLDGLVTDYWSRGRAWPRRLAARFAPGLPERQVTSFNLPLLLSEARRRLGPGGWERTSGRNIWFARRAARVLGPGGGPVFAYCYAALEIATRCRELGRPFVLGQIDGGPAEARIVAAESQRWPQLGSGGEIPPAAYWDRWGRETELAERIVVNSGWSRALLEQAGIAPRKLVELPLAYLPPAPRAPGPPVPEAFGTSRPLRVLFVGQLALRKGLARIFQAVRLLRGAPVRFDFVGPRHLRIPREIRASAQVRMHGPRPPAAVGDGYRRADVLLFPTLSDGFGLVQLEALGHGLPVIASRHCAAVVRPGVDGLLLAEPTAEAIAATLQGLLDDPVRLAELRAGAGTALDRYHPSRVAERFLRILD